MLRTHIVHCLETWICVQNLQKGTIRRWGSHSQKVHKHFEGTVMATVRMGEHVQTMGRQAVSVVFPEVNVVAIASSAAAD